MSKASVFTVGGTVQASNGLYLPRRADDELFEHCRAGNFAYVLTPRQMGKSSMMVRTVQRLEQEGIRSVIIDLSQIGVQVTAEEWYLGLLCMVQDQLDLKSDVIKWWKDHASLGITQRVTTYFEKILLSEMGESLVVFVDEIDTTLSLNFSDDFFAAIRFFHNARSHAPEFKRLSFVLIGVATPGDLIRDPQRTPFNVGHRVDLNDFTREEALPFAAGFDLPDDQARAVLSHVLSWTSGHPYLTQRVCLALVNQPDKDWSENGVSRTITNTFFGERSKQDANLRFVRDMLTARLPPSVNANDLVATYRDVRKGRAVPDDEQSLIKSHLKLSGVVRRDKSQLHVRNPIYAQVFDGRWIKEHLKVNWPKRLARIAVGIFIVLLFLSGPLGIAAWYQRNQAIKRAAQLDKALDIQRSALMEIQRQKEIAEEQRRIAEQQTNIAITESDRAKEQQQQAESAAEAERTAKQEAEQQRLRAEGLSKIATSGQLGALAEVTRQQQPTLLERSVILAKESILQLPDNPSIVGYQALSRGLELLPPYVTRLNSETNIVNSFFISSEAGNEQYLATLSEKSAASFSVRVFEIKTNREIASWNHSGNVLNTHLSANKSFLAVQSDERNVEILEVASGRRLGHITAEGPIKLFQDSPNGQYLTILRDGSRLLEIYDFATGRKVSSLSSSREIQRAIFSPDGRYITIGRSGDTQLAISQVVDGEVAQFDFGNQHLREVVFSPDGKYVAADFNEGSGVLLWESASNGKAAQTLENNNNDRNAKILRFSPTSDRLIIDTTEDKNLDRGRVVVYDSASGNKLSTHPFSKTISSVAVSPNGKYMAIATTGAGVIAFSLDVEGKDVLTDNASYVHFTSDSEFLLLSSYSGTNTLSMSTLSRSSTSLRGFFVDDVATPDGTYIVTFDAENVARLWDLSNAVEIGRLFLSDRIGPSQITSSPSGRFLIAYGGSSVNVWDISSKEHFIHKTVALRDKREVFSRDGRYMATVTESMEPGASARLPVVRLLLQVFDSVSGQSLFPAIAYDGDPDEIVFSSDGKYLATVGDGVVQVWEAQTGREIQRVKTAKMPTEVALSAGGRYLAFIGYDTSAREYQAVQLWDLTRNQQIESPKQKGVTTALFSPNGNSLALAEYVQNKQRLLVWDIAHARERIISEEFSSGDFGFAFSPTGKYLAFATDDGFRVHEVATNKLMLRGSSVPDSEGSSAEVNTIAFSPDETYLISGYDSNRAELWSIGLNKRLMFFNHDDEVYGVAFSHNGNYVATISADNTVKVWNRANGHEIARFVYDSDDVPDVNTVIFSADDRYITVAVRNQDAQTWLWNACDLIEASRDRLTIADLTPEDWKAYLGTELHTYLFKGPRPNICSKSN